MEAVGRSQLFVFASQLSNKADKILLIRTFSVEPDHQEGQNCQDTSGAQPWGYVGNREWGKILWCGKLNFPTRKFFLLKI